MLVFMCRDPGDTTSKVSCCVEPSYCFKNRYFDASVKVPLALASLGRTTGHFSLDLACTSEYAAGMIDGNNTSNRGHISWHRAKQDLCERTGLQL